MIFLSFASRFKLKDAMRHLFVRGRKLDSANFKHTLIDHYGATSAELYTNGRSALAEALRLLVQPGTKVLVNGLTCQAVEQGVKAARCVPLFVDVNNRNYNYDIKKLSAVLATEKNISAIVVQNHLGLAADIQTIERLAKKYNLTIVEDLAHSAGSHYDDGREMGTVGNAVILSFGKDKAIDATSGGALVLRQTPSSARPRIPERNPALKNRARDRFYPLLAWLIRRTYPIKIGKLFAALFFKFGWIVRSADASVSTRIKLPNWQARLAYEQFSRLKNTAIIRRSYARRFKLSEKSAILRIPILVNNRDKLIKTLSKQGIFLADPWYDVPVSPQRHFARSSFDPKNCPNAVEVAAHMFNLPLLPTAKLKPIIKLIKQEEFKYGTKTQS